ncbi:MAG: AraC family transcriptional regulator [Spirochaetota bacterium]
MYNQYMKNFHHVFAGEHEGEDELTVCSLGQVTNKSVYKSAEPGRPVYIFLFFHTTAVVVIRGMRTRVVPMSFVAFPPNMPLCYGDEKGYRHSWISVRGSLIDQALRRYGVPMAVPIACAEYAFYERCQHAVDTEMITHDRPNTSVLRNLFDNFFIDIGRLGVDGADAKHRMSIVKRHIDIHYMERIRLPGLARIAGLSVSRFSSEFKNDYKLSPIEYLIQKRLDEAAHLLTVMTMSVETIASEVGFADVAHFSKTFSRRFGVSPRAFRRGKKTQETE